MMILVAEDDRVSCGILERYVLKWGFACVTAVDGEKAWQAIQENPDIALAIIDWHMPGLTGIELCKKIRIEMSESPLHLILLTGRKEKKDVLTAFAAGVDDFITKPFDPLELHSRIKVGQRLVESNRKLIHQNRQLAEFAKEMESLAEERARMLIHSDRLATLGVLAAGIAHEINNPTTFISGNAQTLERCIPTIEKGLRHLLESEPDKARRINLILEDFPKMTQGIRNGVKRISSIVNHLKSFSRKSDTRDLVPVDLHQSLENALLLCNNRLKHKFEVVRDFDMAVSTVNGDAQRLEQVFVNLIVNATDAMVDTPTKQLRIVTQLENDRIRIHFIDTGTGVPEEKIDQIFQPFYTTKDPGKGTGLGLAVSDGIITEHNGALTVRNIDGGGACFSIVLPNPAKPPTLG
ncbi:hybrid sensor histidine kinase/response regulator [Acanthopleuribacter pedis]|uniref:histidine kinase n=1 Tax=Acanthopleuribacter pedis TaxID=442870 RepID=A0A8J7Q6U4_9BACT|nr:ATP-binding protein [Acanthopleuribacter pedis]MBO1317839.1 response regulator [Acanthopleuribacter pedis]